MPSPENLEIGNRAHELISLYYGALNGIVDSRVGNGNRRRTDIRFHDDASDYRGHIVFLNTAGEVYEIKPWNRYIEGVYQLQDYLGGLQSSFPAIHWRAGTDIDPVPRAWPGAMVHPSLAGQWMTVELRALGVITYRFSFHNDDEDDLTLELVKGVLVIGLLSGMIAPFISAQSSLAALSRF